MEERTGAGSWASGSRSSKVTRLFFSTVINILCSTNAVLLAYLSLTVDTKYYKVGYSPLKSQANTFKAFKVPFSQIKCSKRAIGRSILESKAQIK